MYEVHKLMLKYNHVVFIIRILILIRIPSTSSTRTGMGYACRNHHN